MATDDDAGSSAERPPTQPVFSVPQADGIDVALDSSEPPPSSASSPTTLSPPPGPRTTSATSCTAASNHSEP